MIKKLISLGLTAAALYIGYRFLKPEGAHNYSSLEIDAKLRNVSKDLAKAIAQITHANGRLKTSLTAAEKKEMKYLLLNSYGYVEDEYKALTNTDIGTAVNALFTTAEFSDFRNTASSMRNVVMIANSKKGVASYGVKSGNSISNEGSIRNGQYIGRLIKADNGLVSVYIGKEEKWLQAADVLQVALS